jgi:TatD DNase family protein
MIDTHAHLNEIQDVATAIQRATVAGIEHIVAVGMDLASNKETLELSRRFPQIVYPAIGYHPWSFTLEGIEENLAFLQDNLHRCIALGEVGLDYKVKMKKSFQQEIFSRLLRIAADLGRPVIVHARFSHHRTYTMVRERGLKRAVFHWYSGPLDVLDRILADGYLVSATPALSYSPPHQEAMKVAPLEQILVETDAPVEYQGKISEPADLVQTLAELSRLKGLEPQQVRQITTANARRFFGI